MLDYLWKKFKRDNEVAPEPEHSDYINTKGLEQSISVPEASADDRRWARKFRSASTGDIAKALISAIETGQNWRVWYLINRPLRTTSNLLLGGVKSLGFDGNLRVSEGISKAAETDNVTAAYLLLKFAEKHQTTCIAGAENPVREELEHYTRSNLIDVAQKPGAQVFMLIAQTFAMLADSHSPAHKAERQQLMAQAAIEAAARGNEAHLDAMLDNGLLHPCQFVKAYMDSFYYARVFGAEREITAEERLPFLDWLKRRGIVDEVFAEEAAAVEVRVAAAKDANRESLAKGWKPSARWLPDAQGVILPPGAEQVEISVKDKDGGKLTYIFNYTVERVHQIKDDIQRIVEFSEFEKPRLVEEGKTFLESSRAGTPELVWKKGEPFRLRCNGPQG